MGKPRTAEEWALTCHHLDGDYECLAGKGLCINCARAYARQVGEAVRDNLLVCPVETP